ncbi:MAG: DUF1801 domain-containing protein [Pseudomonadota bacterium]
MLYDVNSPSEYLESLEDDWRKSHLNRIRAMILAAAPRIVERINYKMLAFGTESEELFHLNAQRSYVSLYVGNIETIDPDRELLSAYSLGKGCIRFRKTSNLDDPGLKTFIDRALELFREGDAIDC